ncbi:hypothetical protein PF008_g21507 [Phytophthora fragariae]|uniref:Uncharacterized protein n=1 Tax=Phytophthora fragariae TaxID=53985 RepID=A0A6G0QXI2_9STRA|nr:hypothetical protein PF008_g21507 [Phytophthora fragariae]
MWTSVTQEQIDRLDLEAFLPVVLLLNYSLLMYLAAFYWTRRRERRVALLLLVGTLGTVITILGYDLNKKFKMRSVMFLTYAAEVLILADLASILLSFVSLFSPGVVSDTKGQLISNIAENANLAFIIVFRFYYIGISRGWRSIVKTRKFEVGCYLLFATHEIPFDVISGASGLNWEFAQAIWHRTTLTACLVITARTKIKQFSVAATTYHTNASSTNSVREKWKTRSASGRFLDQKVSSLVRKSGGRSGRSCGRRSSGPQIHASVAVAKQLGIS